MKLSHTLLVNVVEKTAHLSYGYILRNISISRTSSMLAMWLERFI